MPRLTDVLAEIVRHEATLSASINTVQNRFDAISDVSVRNEIGFALRIMKENLGGVLAMKKTCENAIEDERLSALAAEEEETPSP